VIKNKDGRARGKYTVEFKLEAVRPVNGSQSAAVTAKVLGVPKQTLSHWVRQDGQDQLTGADDKSVSAEHMRLHSTLGYVSPMTFEQRWFEAQRHIKKSA